MNLFRWQLDNPPAEPERGQLYVDAPLPAPKLTKSQRKRVSEKRRQKRKNATGKPLAQMMKYKIKFVSLPGEKSQCAEDGSL